MDPSVIVAALALVSSLGGIVVANRFTARTARQAQETTAEIERKKLDAASWADAVKLWQNDVVLLRQRISDDRTEYETDTAKMQGRLEAMEEELRQVQRERIYDRHRIDALVVWSRTAVRMMREAGISFPQPPPGVTDTDPGSGALRPITD